MGVMNQPQISHTQGLCQKAAQLIGVEIPHTHLLIDAVAPLEDSLAQSPVLLRYPVPLSRLCCPVGALLLLLLLLCYGRRRAHTNRAHRPSDGGALAWTR